ncbi:site-specific integrase [Leeuwenhoekiella aequorea]|uniref:site-specific integrase n=1 Tax=Leeuwenhoekiella TaxID=283735 RepID=UPI00048AD63E|nr:site-specific integrase [Leeuwenhoekiella sp. MAR_2009_132]|tara:strand:+ start:523 stop:1737 length:1215 start_codon:yes stop_codon:yes gene_type:complete
MTSNTKIVIRKKSNKEGLYPLAIRITKNRRSTYHYIGHYINLKDWDEKNLKVRKSNPNAAQLNNLITTRLLEANRTLVNLQSNNMDLSANQIKKELYSNSKTKNFYEVAQEFLFELDQNKKLAQLSADKVRVNHVINFHNSKQLTFEEIDEAFLRKFKIYLKSKINLSERSIVNNLIVIRTIYNRAIKSRIVDRKLYPFGADKIRIKIPEAQKIGLSVNEIKAFASLENLTNEEKHAQNIWLFSFYLAGIRIADLLKIKWSDIFDDRLHYTMNKNSKVLSLKLPEKVHPILNYYKPLQNNNDDFIFPEMKIADLSNSKDIYAKTKTATKNINYHLKEVAKKAKIKKKVTMHIARHSFGHISEDKIPIQMLQKLYRHSSLTTTINYQSNFIHKDADDALNSVVNF